MHELSLMEDTLALAMEQAAQAGATRVHRLLLRVGDQSGVVPEALQFAFDALGPTVLGEGVRLDIERVPVVCWCSQCHDSFQPNEIIYACPVCDRLSDEVRQGKEIELASMEVS